MQITLYSQTSAGSEFVPVTGTRFILGRGEDADYQLPDDNDGGIAHWHAAICCADEHLWLEPLGGETFVNGQLAPSEGLPLTDQTELRLGNSTRLIVSVERQKAAAPSSRQRAAPRHPAPQHMSLRAPVIAAMILLMLILGAAGTLAVRKRSDHGPTIPPGTKTPEAVPPPKVTPAERAQSLPPPPPVQFKLYSQMTEAEKRIFIKERAQGISLAFGKGIRPYGFEGEAVGWIKEWVDSYHFRLGRGRKSALTDCRNPKPLNSAPPHLWHDDLQSLYSRASCHAPLICQAFRKEGVSEIVGLYIVMIETEYNNLCFDNFANAAGMFQFTRDTAKDYDLSPDDRCNAPLMAKKAALYLKKRQNELGAGQMSIPLTIAAYNRGVKNIDRDLMKAIDSENPERSFWELKHQSVKVLAGAPRAAETLKYVPKFFAAAIIGENPEVFGLTINRLSSYSAWPDER